MNQSLVFNDIEVNKKDFYASKKAMPLNLVNLNNIIISKRVKNNNDTSKYFIGYHYEDKITPLYIILPQISGYNDTFKYFIGYHYEEKIRPMYIILPQFSGYIKIF